MEYKQTTQMDFDDTCSTGLFLGLGFKPAVERLPPKAAAEVFAPSDHLTLGLSGEAADHDDSVAASSFSNASVKRERDVTCGSEELVVRDRVRSRVSTTDEDDDICTNNARKKFRLNKDQSALMEESFKHHSTLNPKQKQEIARRLNIRTRQVEVWFQNRRARTKLKQTEVDCELWKKCCETLRDENKRLQKELQELKALKLAAQPLYMQLPAAATLTMCPSCKRIGGGGGEDNTSKRPFTMAPKSHFFNPFTNPSAAC